MLSFSFSVYSFTIFERCVEALSIKMSQSLRSKLESESMKLLSSFKNSAKISPFTVPLAAAAKTEPVEVIATIRLIESVNQILLTHHSLPFSSQEWVALVHLENSVSSMFMRILNLLNALVNRNAKIVFRILCLLWSTPKGLDFPFLKLRWSFVFRYPLTTLWGRWIL